MSMCAWLTLRFDKVKVHGTHEDVHWRYDVTEYSHKETTARRNKQSKR
jgi:hypothetical protein